MEGKILTSFGPGPPGFQFSAVLGYPRTTGEVKRSGSAPGERPLLATGQTLEELGEGAEDEVRLGPGGNAVVLA